MTIDLSNLPRVINPVYYPYINNDKFYNIFFGGAASGKSMFVAQRIVYRLLKEKGHNFLIIRRVDRTNRDSTFAIIKRVISSWNMSDLFKINKSDMTITCLVNNNQILFKGLDDPEKLKSITFETGPLTEIWIEEATEISQEDFAQLQLRLRGKSKIKKQVTMSFNPISHLSWVKQFFFDNPPEPGRLMVLKTTYQDNLYLEPEDKAIIENLKTIDPIYYNIYALGEWGVIGNLVFNNYVIENFKYTEKDMDSIFCGMDFGFNHPTAIEKLGYKDGEMYILKELYVKGLTNDEVIKRNYQEKIITKKDYVIADSAEPARIKEWKQSGYRVYPSKKGKESVRYGLDYLRRTRIHIHKTMCPGVAREFTNYKYREDKEGNVLDEPVPFKDDGIAALRYATESIWNRPRAKVSKVGAESLGF